MKKVYLLAFLLISAIYNFAQVSVTATAATTGPTSYTTLKAAFDAVNAGTHKGIISITINGSTTETASAVLFASGTGSSSYTALSVKPTGGAASSITGNIAAPLIDLDGADNVTIDGLNTGNNALTISNTNTSGVTNTSTIRFIDDAVGNTITNTTILGASTSATLGTIYFAAGVTVTGNDNNTVSNCNIGDAAGSFPANAVYSVGSATAGQENSNITINNNNIYNFFHADIATVGILVSTGNTDWSISNNKLYQTATRTYTTSQTHRCIQVAAGNNYSVINNVIGYASPTATGVYTLAGTVATRFIGIDLAVGSTVASSVQNNIINSFSLATSSGASTVNGIWCAINVTSGDVNVGTLTGNTIGTTNGLSAIVANPTTAGAGVIPINSSSTGNIVIANNSIGGIDLLPSGVLSGSIQGIQSTGTAGSITISNNTIGNATANNIRVGNQGTTTGNGIVRGILNSNAGTIIIKGNTIRNLAHNSNNAVSLFRAVECQNGTASITNNNISNVTAFGTSVSVSTPEGVGILVTTALPGLIIDGNTISNLSVTNTSTTTGITLQGIYLGSTVTSVSVTKNKIYGFSNASNSASATVPSIVAGIYIRDAGVANPNILVANNMISFGNAQTTNTAFIGIWNAIASANGLTSKIYYNTVNIEGTVTAGTQPTFCYYRGDFSMVAFNAPIVDLKNNLFTNTRLNITGGKNYAISNGYGAASSSSVGWGSNASDYNILNADPSTIGYWSGDQSFAGWQTASSSDVHGLSGTGVTYLNSASDLHLVTTANIGVDGKATPLVSITGDIDNDTRNATTPDIGADEFTYNGSVPIVFEYFKGARQNSINLLNWKGSCSSSSVQFDIERSIDTRTFTSIGSFFATQSRCMQPFDFTDNAPKPGTNYYRLKMKEADGKISYSMIIAIINKESGFEIVSMMPTLVKHSNAVLNVTAAQKTMLSILITDASGRIVAQQNQTVTPGSNMLNLNLGNLSKGSYQLTGFTPDGQTRTIRFVKQ